MMVDGKEINGIVAVKKFFGFVGMQEFRKEWGELTEDDKKQLSDGLSGPEPSFTY